MIKVLIADDQALIRESLQIILSAHADIEVVGTVGDGKEVLEKLGVTDPVFDVARELEQRGATAGGAAQDVLEAQAMMAEDPALESEVDTRLAAGARRRPHRHCRPGAPTARCS